MLRIDFVYTARWVKEIRKSKGKTGGSGTKGEHGRPWGKKEVPISTSKVALHLAAGNQKPGHHLAESNVNQWVF